VEIVQDSELVARSLLYIFFPLLLPDIFITYLPLHLLMHTDVQYDLFQKAQRES